MKVISTMENQSYRVMDESFDESTVSGGIGLGVSITPPAVGPLVPPNSTLVLDVDLLDFN